MRILFNFATRSRPEKAFKCIDNIISMARHDDYVILMVMDIDDPAMNTREVYDRLKSYGDKVIPSYGYSTGKINAINREINYHDSWDIVVNTSDDMWFVKEGFDLQIIEDMKRLYPDTDGVLHYHDSHHYGDKLMTMSIIGRLYFLRDKFIYNNDFVSLFVDNLAKDVAVCRGKYSYQGDNNILFNHIHPMHNKGVPIDDQYRYTESFYEQDRQTYMRHKSNGYYL